METQTKLESHYHKHNQPESAVGHGSGSRETRVHVCTSVAQLTAITECNTTSPYHFPTPPPLLALADPFTAACGVDPEERREPFPLDPLSPCCCCCCTCCTCCTCCCCTSGRIVPEGSNALPPPLSACPVKEGGGLIREMQQGGMCGKVMRGDEYVLRVTKQTVQHSITA